MAEDVFEKHFFLETFTQITIYNIISFISREGMNFLFNNLTVFFSL